MSNPAINWPNSFGKIPFLQTHPYFLPCAISGSIAAVTFVLLLFGLKEVYISRDEACLPWTSLLTLSSLYRHIRLSKTKTAFILIEKGNKQ